MLKLVIIVYFLIGLIYSVSCSCTFPTTLRGDWESPAKGNLTFSSSQLTGYDVYTYTNLTFSCEIKSGTKYILQSNNFTVLAGNEVYALLCLKITKRTSNKYTYFILSSELPDTNGERVVFIDSSVAPVTEALACDDTTVQDTPQNTKLIVKYGEASNEAIQCPDSILGQYSYNNWTSCNDSLWDTCTDVNTMVFDYGMCSSTMLGFSESGNVMCLYKVASGSQVITYVYNTDASVNSTVNGTYQFSCMVVDSNADGFVYVTQYPEDCQANQTAYYVLSPGIELQLQVNFPTNSTTTTEAPAEVSQAGLIAGLVVLFLIIIAVVVVVVVYFIWKKKKAVAPTGITTAKENVEGIEVQPPTKEPIMLEKPDGRETITPSAMSAHIQSRSGSHGKLKQVLGTAEYTMTGETSFVNSDDVVDADGSSSQEINSGHTDDDKLTDYTIGANTDANEPEASPRKLPPITEKPTSPTDTRLDKPLPPIR